MSETSTARVLTELTNACHDTASEKGFWEMPAPEMMQLNLKLLLIVSEAIEAHNVLRDVYESDTQQMDDLAEELADIVIRTFDIGSWIHGDFGRVILDKMEKNRGRPRKHNRAF